MNKPGSIQMIFAVASKCQHPIDQARLIEMIEDCGELEYWLVEFLNDGARKYKVLIKKQNEPVKVTHES